MSLVGSNLALNYKMTLRSSHNKIQCCVFLMPYIGVTSGNVMWCDIVYAVVGLTHDLSLLHWFISTHRIYG